MIHVTSIEVFGSTERGDFKGQLRLEQGLNVFSGHNAYGKSTAITAIPWCLGLEAMFGLEDNDPARFPSAVRDLIILDGHDVPVITSTARITLKREDGATVVLSRAIKGFDLERVEVDESTPDGGVRSSVLHARKRTMSDASGGLQQFLFEWMKIPRTNLMNNKGKKSEIYLENLAPLFYIDQTEGWTDLQALQVHRYGLQEVSESAVEYLLGAQKSLAKRLLQQEHVVVEAKLKGEAEILAARVVRLFHSQGWTFDWSTRGSPNDIAKRWSLKTLSQIAFEKFRMNVPAEQKRLEARLASTKDALTSAPKGASDLGPSSQASQEVIDLKTKRHKLRGELRDARMQHEDQRALLATIEHRWHSSKDVLRLKVQGIGRLDQVECPTCHRDLDPSTFQLTQQSNASVAAHIDALEKQRQMIRDNVAALESETTRIQHDLELVEQRFRAATKSLEVVNSAIGTTREGLAKAALDMSRLERELGSLREYAKSVDDLEADIGLWLAEVNSVEPTEVAEDDLANRVKEFGSKLRDQLLALGHSAVTKKNLGAISLDERYVPYLHTRRLRSLGSASDHPRLVAAYVLALAQASRVLAGCHPGFVVLDEPQQQNPDNTHVELFLKFLESAAKEKKVQVIVTTHLKSGQPERLKKGGVRVVELPRGHFLKMQAR